MPTAQFDPWDAIIRSVARDHSILGKHRHHGGSNAEGMFSYPSKTAVQSVLESRPGGSVTAKHLREIQELEGDW